MSTVTPLNGLQFMMLRWEEFHPMNAIHVVHLSKSYDSKSVEQIITERCASLGVSQIEFTHRRRKVRFVDTDKSQRQSPPFKHLFRSGPTALVLQELMNQELNLPFPEGVHWPVRFFLVETTDGQFLVLNYQHAISDSRGISLVIKEILRALEGKAPEVERLDRNPPTVGEMFPGKLTSRGLFTRAKEFSAELIDSMTCFFHPGGFKPDLSVESGIHATNLCTQTLVQTARGLGVKVQDLLFAALFEALAIHFKDELKKSKRKTLAVYAPADLRRESQVQTDTALGQILGCITIRESFKSKLSFTDLVKSVARKTRRIKQNGFYREHMLQMNIMSRIWDCFPRFANRKAGPMLVPLNGFISNVNLSDFLENEIGEGEIQNYYRFSGTGILTPMMLGMTTVGETFNLTTTHHKSVFQSEDIAKIVAHIQRRLEGELADKHDTTRNYPVIKRYQPVQEEQVTETVAC